MKQNKPLTKEIPISPKKMGELGRDYRSFITGSTHLGFEVANLQGLADYKPCP
jgi:hypothetical protein